MPSLKTKAESKMSTKARKNLLNGLHIFSEACPPFLNPTRDINERSFNAVAEGNAEIASKKF